MKLSQSAHFVQRKGSPSRTKTDIKNRAYKKEELSMQPISILIKINKNDELQPAFVDTFSKIILNNTNFDFQQCYGNIKTTTYSQFYETLRNLGNQMNRAKPCKDFNENFMGLTVSDKMGFKKTKSYQNVRKGSIQITPKMQKKNYVFCFQAYKNSIILLIDVSPYMLLYDYSTKSFLLQNAQQITRNLFIELERHYNERKNGHSGPSYLISCYVFSVYSEEIEEVIKDEEIFFADGHEKKFQNRSLISDYICAYLNKSRLPYIERKDARPISISHFIQKILNVQQGNSGIKTIVTISAFKQVDYHPYIFFNSNWYTFCFICAGELNFGSFLIDVSEIVDRCSKNPYLQTKFVYKCRFLENWEKVYLIEREGRQFKYIDSSLQKSRAILYISSHGDKKETIFDDILKFDLKLNGRKKRCEGTYRSNDSIQGVVSKNPQLLVQYEFNIPAENISEIMRTKYLQGWQQHSTQKYPQNTKYQFQLEFANRAGIRYQATRIEDHFVVKVSSLLIENQLSSPYEKIYKERKEIASKIKKIDLINTSNFDIVTTFKNTAQSESKLKKDSNYKFYINFDDQGDEDKKMLDQIISDHQQWNCYFKVRRIFVHFIPNSHFLNDFNELLNEVGYFLGERISNLCFMHRKEKKQKLIDNIKEREVSRWNIIFCKVSGIFRFLEFKFGFLKYNDNQIKQTIENIEGKLMSKKLSNGSLKIIPEDIYNYCIQKFDQPKLWKKSLSSIFQKTWRINFKNEYLCKLFRFMNNKIIKKLGYQHLKTKLSSWYYYNTLTFGDKQNKRDKGLFLEINCEGTNLIEFKLEAFPSFCIVPALSNKDSFMDYPGSQKNLYHLTQRSISSSSNQQSISSASLPLPSNNSNKDFLQSKPNPNQGKYKNSFLELFQLLASQLKQSQKRAINMVKCYTEIYDALVKKKLQEKKSGIEDEEFMWKVKQFYKFSSQDFQTQFLTNLMQIKKEYYTEYIQENQKGSNRRATIKIQQNIVVNQLFQINTDEIPEPTEYLMQSSIAMIKGDLVLSSKTHTDKKYIFFLVTPHRAVYLWKKEFSCKIYFRFLNNIYCNSSLIEREEAELKTSVEKELRNRINRQLREQQYLTFYNVVAEEQADIATSVMHVRTRRQSKVKEHSILAMLRKSQKVVSSFVGVSLNCSEIFSIINKPQNAILQSRIIKVLIQFQKRFYQYISLFFENARFNLQTEEYGITTFKHDQDLSKIYKTNESNMKKQQARKEEKLKSQDQQASAYFNNYFYEKKGVFFSEKRHQKFMIKNINDYGNFDNIVAKICTNTGIPIYEQNFVSLFINKARKRSGQVVKQNMQTSKIEININFFGFKADKSSAKVRWLNEIMNQLLTECVTYLNIVTVTQPNDIKEIENKLTQYIVRGPCEKVPDDLWNESEIVRQIQSGHMRKLVPFCQYSFKPFPPKFISRQIEISPVFYNVNTKSNSLIYLKYWLTIQITPARVLKTKLIPFKHINLLTQAILDLDKTVYEAKMNKMVEDYLAELLKFLRVRDIFKGIQHKLMFPLDPPILLYINNQIFKKLEEEKRKSMKIKVPKKFKNRTANYPALELKSLSSHYTTDQSTTLSFMEQSTPLPFSSITSPLRFSQQSQQSGSEDVSSLKNYFKLSLIYQGSISYFPKFEPSEIFSLLACCEKLNPYAIRNLENTYIFFNPELKEYFIFYLQESIVNAALQAQDTYNLPAFSSAGGHAEKKRNSSLIYSVYCIDSTVPADMIQKLHGGLIKKALEEVTFYKIAKILHVSHSIIDEAEEEYFRQGSKEELTFHIPHIQKKSNLNQYIKQHLEKAFYHKKTQFKSELRKKEVESEGVEVGNKDNRDEQKLVNRKKIKKQLSHSQECEMRCVPQTWIFNTIETRYLEQTFGKCMFLTRVMIYDYMDTCQNASFWYRHVKEKEQKNHQKQYIYPFMQKKQQPEIGNNSNQKLLLSYLQGFKQKPVRQRSKSIESLLRDKDFLDSKETIDHFGKKSWAPNLNQNENYTIIKFEIFSSFGFPRINLIKNMYKQLLYFGVYDFYLENRIFRDLITNSVLKRTTSNKIKKKSILAHLKQKIEMIDPQRKSFENEQDQLHQSLTLPIQRTLSSPIKQSIGKPQSFIVLCNDEFVNEIYISFLDMFHTLEHQIPIKNTPSVLLYKTQKKVLIQQKTPSLLHFIKLFSDLFYKNTKHEERYALRLIVYGIQKKTLQTYFWGIEVDRPHLIQKKCKFSTLFQEISQQIEKKGCEFSKMGVFFCDSLHDIDSLRESFFLKDYEISKDNQSQESRVWETFNRTDRLNIEFEWIKKFEEGRSFCQNQFLFKRSILMHYQISDLQFTCYTYNFKDKQNMQFLEHFTEIELWFAQKYRLYTFICNLKKLQSEDQTIQYEIPPIQTGKDSNSSNKIYSLQRKTTSGESLPYKSFKSSQNHEPQLNLTKLVKSLAFDQIPFKNFAKSRSAIEKMYKILSSHTVPYSNYPEYKGKEKSKLAKIGKEYLSIIRQYFGNEKNVKKDSVFIQDVSEVQKNKQR